MLARFRIQIKVFFTGDSIAPCSSLFRNVYRKHRVLNPPLHSSLIVHPSITTMILNGQNGQEFTTGTVCLCCFDKKHFVLTNILKYTKYTKQNRILQIAVSTYFTKEAFVFCNTTTTIITTTITMKETRNLVSRNALYAPQLYQWIVPSFARKCKIVSVPLHPSSSRWPSGTHHVHVDCT